MRDVVPSIQTGEQKWYLQMQLLNPPQHSECFRREQSAQGGSLLWFNEWVDNGQLLAIVRPGFETDREDIEEPTRSIDR